MELPVYLSLALWHAAEHVLELGSGDGHYLRRLALYFPAKSYTGIDVDERAIQTARTQSGPSDDASTHRNERAIAFETADALRYTGRFSVAVARLLVQHLERADALFVATPNFLQRDGTLIAIDSNDQTRFL